MKKGDIVRGITERGKVFHPVVFLQENTDRSLIGVVLTHNDNRPDNILMEKDHFVELDANGQKYEVYFDDTCLVGKRFIKPEEWGPFRKVGELTKKGLDFVESKTVNETPTFWTVYSPDSRT